MTELDEVIELVQRTILVGQGFNFVSKNEAVELRHNINKPFNQDGWSILHIAVYQYDQSHMLFSLMSKLSRSGRKTGNVKNDIFRLIELLIKCGADVNLGDKYGRPPIFFAASKEVSELLMAHGALVFSQDLQFSALHVQCFLGKRYLDPFLQNDLSALKQDDSKKLPLHFALSQGKVGLEEITSLVNCAPESTGIPDDEEIYPLGYAALYASKEIFLFLLKNSSIHVIETTCDQIYKEIIVLDDSNDMKRESPQNGFNGISILGSMLDKKNQIQPVGDIEECNTPLSTYASTRTLDDMSLNIDAAITKFYDIGSETYEIYNAPSEYIPLSGGGRNRNKKSIIRDLEQETADRKKDAPAFIMVSGKRINLCPDNHGGKHTKCSKSLNKDFMLKWKDGKQRFAPATFSPEYADKYLETLIEVIKTRATEESISGLVEMPEDIGFDEAKETNIIELYYGGSVGSHIRPKYCRSGKDCVGMVSFNPNRISDNDSSSSSSSSSGFSASVSVDPKSEDIPQVQIPQLRPSSPAFFGDGSKSPRHFVIDRTLSPPNADSVESDISSSARDKILEDKSEAQPGSPKKELESIVRMSL